MMGCLYVMLLMLVMPATKPADASSPASYRCMQIDRPITIDGRLDDPAWKTAAWTSDFPDILGGAHPPPTLRTRAKMLWDETNFYVAFQVAEPDVHASMRQHDSPLYKENAVELFLDPNSNGTHYCELEINALGTTFDTAMDKPYSAGGKDDDSFELRGMKLAIHVDGTLNNNADRDEGWTAELAIPWKALRPLTSRDLPPKPGSRWRMELARVEHTAHPRRMTVSAWSPIGRVDLHVPEDWGWIEFAP